MSDKTAPILHPWEELCDKWQANELCTEEVVGHLLIWVQQQEGCLLTLLREWEELTHSLADLDARLRSLEKKLV
ncbi:hypothetical protein KFU94_19195 [Chloroflexi bacterium TSY]|nr:hypothetical protein [Chloroflexi bacterium TSY]